MDREQIERQLGEQEGRGLSRKLDRASLGLGFVAALVSLAFWSTHDNWAASVSGVVAAFLVISALVRWQLGQLKSAGPEPAVNGSPLQALRYRWYHAPHMVAQTVMAAVVGLAGFGYAVAFGDHFGGMLPGFLWATLFFGVAYAAWRVASPKTRDADRARAATNLAKNRSVRGRLTFFV
jgi:hypothetical protein